MHRIALLACTSTPFGGYLKGLGAFRLVSEQTDPGARGFWDGDTFTLETAVGPEELTAFFLERYVPTAIVAPWNGGSGFYVTDNREAISAIATSTSPRLAEYRAAIQICAGLTEVAGGKGGNEEERRTSILRQCRNLLPDRAVEWLDAAVGISADGTRSFAPVLGTGGNEGRLDYTNNFMARVTALLLTASTKDTVRELLCSALFGERTTALQPGATGQFNPGRAGGVNQGQGIAHESVVNPWDLVLTLEGAVAWASGLYRRQGAAYRSFLCSPFTVRARRIGYASAAEADEARAEIWAPLWDRPVRYGELKSLLREGRATVQGKPASDTLEFAEAACSLGIDRGIQGFVRYSLLKRRGDSYVALPAGIFPTGYRSEADYIREFQQVFQTNAWDLPKGTENLRRSVEAAIYQVLLKGGQERMCEVAASLGRLLRRMLTTTNYRLPSASLEARRWVAACGFEGTPEVRIAAALASVWSSNAGPITANLSHSDKHFAWAGNDLCGRLISVLGRRLQSGGADGIEGNPTGGACAIHPGDATLFIEGSVCDVLIEDLLFAFCAFNWKEFEAPSYRTAEVLPTYAVLKHLFLSRAINLRGEPRLLRADPRILPLLLRGDIGDAASIAVSRLRIAGLRPLELPYRGGLDARRLAASLLIPVWQGATLAAGIFRPEESLLDVTA